MRGWRTAGSLLVAAATLVLGGCASVYTYNPKSSGGEQSLRYMQGVGTLTARMPEYEVFMYSTFRTQGFTDPTFTVGYANNTDTPINFSTDNIRAYFRGSPVPIYTYIEKSVQIENEKRGQQIALAILGGLAAAGAAYSASHQTYRTNYSGNVFAGGRSAAFRASSITRVYDPAAGILAGAAVGGATGLGIRQIEFSADAKQQAALSILQQTTVEPRGMIVGNVILKDCCDQFTRPDDMVRFEVTVGSSTQVFEFSRAQIQAR